MASLNHVCIWSEKGWTPITAKEAARLHPTGGGVSYKSGLFRCDLCGQYVTLANGQKNDSYFRHYSDVKSKDCPDRVQVSTSINSFLPGVHTLPLKLRKITSTSFELQMGFIALPDELFPLIQNKSIKITARGNAEKPLIYLGTRIQKDCTTYMSLGNQISDAYTVEVQAHPKEIEQIWPRVVEGIDRNGALFDSQTGKKLPPDADVQIQHTYYLLTGQILCCERDVEIRRISTVYDGFTRWMIYEVKATEFSQQVARFFMNYNCRLTENPVVTFPLWPVCVEKPYVILHKHADITMFLQGYCVQPKVFPSSYIRLFRSQDKDQMVFCLNSRERQQLLSTGRTKVLKYMYLWRTELSETAATPVIEVTDIEGNPIHPLIQNTLPKGNTTVYEMFHLSTSDIRTPWEIMTQDIQWLKMQTESNVDYLNLRPPFRTYWVRQPDHNLISICKFSTNGSPMYYLYRIEQDQAYYSPIPEWMLMDPVWTGVERHTNYRLFSNSLLAHLGSLPPTRFHKDGEIVSLRLEYRMPPREMNLIKLYRFAAKDLLRWGLYGKLPERLRCEQQWSLLSPLKRILESSGCNLFVNDGMIIAERDGNRKTIEVYASHKFFSFKDFRNQLAVWQRKSIISLCARSTGNLLFRYILLFQCITHLGQTYILLPIGVKMGLQNRDKDGKICMNLL